MTVIAYLHNGQLYMKPVVCYKWKPYHTLIAYLHPKLGAFFCSYVQPGRKDLSRIYCLMLKICYI